MFVLRICLDIGTHSDCFIMFILWILQFEIVLSRNSICMALLTHTTNTIHDQKFVLNKLQKFRIRMDCREQLMREIEFLGGNHNKVNRTFKQFLAITPIRHHITICFPSLNLNVIGYKGLFHCDV